MGDYDEYEELWNEQRPNVVRHPKLCHPVTAQPFLAQLQFLDDLARHCGSTAFSEAIAEIGQLKLIGNDGQWRDKWRNDTDADPAASDDRFAVHLVDKMIAAGHSETDAVAFVVWDQEMPGANFKAAWARLRALYYAANPDRPRKKRGRPRGS